MANQPNRQSSEERPPLPKRERDANGGRPDPIGEAGKRILTQEN
jgi:hypothetical protein